MTDASEVVLRQRFCRGAGCGRIFFICRSCDRGQCYCSDGCRAEAVRRQRREANRRHQQSDEGRRDHCDRQREYRERFAQRRVTDQPSQAAALSGRIPIAEQVPGEDTTRVTDVPRQRHRRLFCIICGRAGRFIDPFDRSRKAYGCRQRQGRRVPPPLLR